MNPIIIAVVLGGVAYLIYSQVFGTPVADIRFVTGPDGLQRWDPSQKGALAGVLNSSHLEPSGTDRVWNVLPGPGGETALAAVKKMQQKPGSTVFTSANVLEPGAARFVAEETSQAELDKLKGQKSVAALPGGM